MAERADHTVVGAGTTAGHAWEPDGGSRAAEAESDDYLESLLTTGARMPQRLGREARQVTPARAGGESPPGPVVSVHPERPRGDLAKNQAGIASRLDKGGR